MVFALSPWICPAGVKGRFVSGQVRNAWTGSASSCVLVGSREAAAYLYPSTRMGLAYTAGR